MLVTMTVFGTQLSKLSYKTLISINDEDTVTEVERQPELSSGFTLYVIAWLLVCAAAVCAVLVARSSAKPSSIEMSDLQADSKETQPIPDALAPSPTKPRIQISGMNLCVVFLMTIASFLLFTSFESPLWAKKVREKGKEQK